MNKLVHGKGYNDGSKPANIGGKSVKEYILWVGMLERCFSDSCQTKHPTYKGCSVSDNFLNYSYFYDWCHNQAGFKGVDGKGRYWHLDKDILYKENKMYSENTCVFVPNEINLFFTDCGNSRGEYPIGVCFHKRVGKHAASCSAVDGKRKHLGYFNTPEEAFNAYKPFKEALCKQLALKWQSEIDERLFNAMMNWEVNYERL